MAETKLTGEQRVDALCKELMERYGIVLSDDVTGAQDEADENEDEEPVVTPELDPNHEANSDSDPDPEPDVIH